jgi:hypothetical protein
MTLKLSSLFALACLTAALAVGLAVMFSPAVALAAPLHPVHAVALAAFVALATPIDLSPIVNGIIVPLLTPVLGAAFLWVAYKVSSLFHFHIQQGQRALLEKAISNGLNYASMKLGETPMTLSTHSAAISTVASYVNKAAPGAVKALGLDKASGSLAAAIIARLPDASEAGPSPAAVTAVVNG